MNSGEGSYLTIIYQDNGWQQHIKVYADGSRDEWLEPDHQ